MDRIYFYYKCSSCGYEKTMSFYDPSDDGAHRVGFDINDDNAKKEQELLKNNCPSCEKGQMERIE